MIRAIILGTLALAFAFVYSLFFSTPMDAKTLRGGLHPDCNITMPCIGPAASVKPTSRREARRIARGQRLEQAMPFGSAITDPTPGAATRFIRGRLVCARNVGAELARRGIRGTGSALAKSYLHWGRPSGPQPGAVAVFSRGRRGGHVAIVQSVRPDGTVIYLNPSSRRQTWQVGPYNRRPIAFRVAG